MTDPLKLVVVSAGTSVPSSTRMLADRLATATADALNRDGRGIETTIVEVRDLAHEVVDATLTRFPGERLRAAQFALRSADGVIVVTPTYNVSYSGLFKSFVDVLDEGTLQGVSVLLAATGGTARHSLAIDYALRPLFGYLKADVVPTTVFAASEDFGASTTASDSSSLGARAGRAGSELAAAMVRGAGGGAAGDGSGGTAADRREDGTTTSAANAGGRAVADEFDDFVPMGSLLGR